MVPTPLIVQQAVSEFFRQWYFGLRPNLTLKTYQNGDVMISSTLLINEIQNQINHSTDQRNSGNHKKKSGRSSRRRRQIKRNDARNEAIASPSTLTDSDIGVATDQEPPFLEEVNDALQHCMINAAVQTVATSVDFACETTPTSLPREPMLSIVNNASISIPPREIFHHATLNASQAICGKHPSQLTPEETKKFNFYLARKCEMGQPVESDVVYLPSSMRNCLHCGYLT